MTDIINLYPQTSCACATCANNTPVPTGPRSNMSVRGCIPPKSFDTYNRLEFDVRRAPQRYSGGPTQWYDLNPQAYTSKIADGFERITCSVCSTSQGHGAPGEQKESGYISLDPRQYSTTRADYLVLDRPPTDGNVRLADVYNPKYTNYGHLRTGGYAPYENIKDGDVTYYVDKSIQDAFYHPVFSEQAIEHAVLYQDPMSAMKPEYNRERIVNTENPVTTTPETYPYCLSSIQDSQSHREDLMALQQRKHNQEKWTARWTSGQN